jgi:hypothetical protein
VAPAQNSVVETLSSPSLQFWSLEVPGDVVEVTLVTPNSWKPAVHFFWQQTALSVAVAQVCPAQNAVVLICSNPTSHFPGLVVDVPPLNSKPALHICLQQ